MKRLVILLILVSLPPIACSVGPAADMEATEQAALASPQSVPATEPLNPEPTHTPSASPPPEPSDTPTRTPSDTPVPTGTPAPTGTPVPTDTPPPGPTATPTSAPPTPTEVRAPPTPTQPPESVKLVNPQRYQVEYVVTVRNGGFDLDRLLVYQPRPVEWDTQQEVTVDAVSPRVAKAGVDPVLGNGLYYWEMAGEPKRGEATAFRIQFALTAYELTTDIDPDQVRPYNQDDALYKLYTRSERFVEATDSQIVELADQVAGGETNPYLLARRFYDYVIDTASYQLLGQGLLGAETLLTTGQGECGDYAALFVALSRAKGIPARPVVGYWAISGLEQTHVWAEFYLEGYGWIPVDPTTGQLQPDQRDYYFGNIDNQRVILNKGYNISLDPPRPDNFKAPFLQVPLWWFWGSGGDANTVSLERTSWTVAVAP